MLMKKIIAGAVAGAIAASSIIVTNLVVDAAPVETLPSGNERVLYSADLSSIAEKNGTTNNWEEMGNINISGIDSAVMENENAYVKMTFSDLGTNGDSNTPVEEIIGWGWDSYNSWLVGAKWYNNYSGEFEVSFVPILVDGVLTAYLPISDFALDEWGQIGGNMQSGNCSTTNISSLKVVEFVAAEEDENGDLPLPSSEILVDELKNTRA